MEALRYVFLKTVKNKVLKALRKPATYILGIIIIGYAVMIFGGAVSFSSDIKIDSPQVLVLVLSALILISLPTAMISYARRKGVVFYPSDIHFIFTAPISPKMVLVYANVKMYLLSLVINLCICLGGIFVFNVEIWKMAVYFLFSFVLETIFEVCLMLTLYGNERFSEKVVKLFAGIIWIVVLFFLFFIVYHVVTQGFSLDTIHGIVYSPVLLLVPILGWNMGVIQLIILGPTALTVTCAALYFVTTVIFVVLAKKMKCTGEYYEDSAKFADDFQEILNKKQKGEIATIGKKKKYGKASIEYKGTRAKAIYYRQLLEYKKGRFFIFGMMTLVCFAIGVVLSVMTYLKHLDSQYGAFIILGAAAYVSFCLTAYATKWSKELENPYTFLLPDSPFKKLWYATKIEHIRSVIDGCLMAILPGIFMGLSPLQVILIILVYVCIQANKLYSGLLAEALVGNVLGNAGRQLVRMLFQGLVLGLGVAAAIIPGLFIGFEAALFIVVVYAVLITGLIAFLASVMFSRMETFGNE